MFWDRALSLFLSVVLMLPLSTVFEMSVEAAVANQSRLENFRSDVLRQRVALLGSFSEFVDPAQEERLTEQTRKVLNRYTRSYGASSIANFNLPANPNRVYFKPTSNKELDAAQKSFLETASRQNNIEIIALMGLKDLGEEVEVELQLFDARIQTLSAIERSKVLPSRGEAALEDLVYRTMNYLDAEGFVHDSPQNILMPPLSAQKDETLVKLKAAGQDEVSVNPADLSRGQLAGSVAVGGEQTPFWETWWFYTLVGGGLLTAGGLSYYFLVVNQPAKKATIGFTFPSQ